MTEQSGSALAAALAQLQANLPEIKKTQEAKVKNDKGQMIYSYNYAGLPEITEALLPRLADFGLSFIAKPTYSGERFVLAYSLLHVSGEREDGQYPLPTSGSPQAIGSAITYGRRYCLCAVTGIAAEDDDDGAVASAPPPRKRAQKAPGVGQQSAKHRALHAAYRERGIETHEHRVSFAAAVLGHEVETTAALPDEEVDQVLAVLKAGPPIADPVAGVDAFPDEEKP